MPVDDDARGVGPRGGDLADEQRMPAVADHLADAPGPGDLARQERDGAIHVGRVVGDRAHARDAQQLEQALAFVRRHGVGVLGVGG